jgi:hypothetical protein
MRRASIAASTVRDAQLAIVVAGARGVPIDQRERYLAAIAANLMSPRRITDAEVAAAVERARFRFGVQL